MNIAHEVAKILEGQLVGTIAATSGWSMHIGRMPDDRQIPDTALAVRLSGGEPSNPKWLLDFPNVQVTIRGAANGYQAAYDKAIEVHDVLIGLVAQDVVGGRIDSVTGIGYINALGFDSNERPEFTVNFRLIVEPNGTPNSKRLPLT